MESQNFSFGKEESRKSIAKQLLKDKKFWFASALIIWAAALQGHMMWLQRQDSFKQKFGNLNDESTNQQELADNHESIIK